MIPQLGAEPSAPFPDPMEAMESPDGLLAWGGDLDPVRLGHAYHQGIFPWYSEQQPILWWSPAQRCVLFPSEVHVSRRLERLLKQDRFSITSDVAFEAVIRGCALPRPSQDTTWITEDMINAYLQLHRMGIAHSIEVWNGEDLAGGLYGLSLGRVFFGESMFSHVTDASKVAMVSLCRQLARWDYAMMDCQVSNPHLVSMGAVQVPRETFLTLLEQHVNRPGPAETFAQAFPGTGA